MRFLSDVDARSLWNFLLLRSLTCCNQTRLYAILTIMVSPFSMAWSISWLIIEMLDKLGLSVSISVARHWYVSWSFLNTSSYAHKIQDVLWLMFLLKLYWYNLYLLTIVYLLFQILYHIWILNWYWILLYTCKTIISANST